MDFAPFDRRHYPVLSVRDGYDEWAAVYDSPVLDAMDVRLLERLKSVAWTSVRRVVDLACGTGRIGAWLKAAGAQTVDGIDITPAMLDKARARGVYNELRLGDLAATGFSEGAYDLVTEVLACEHLRDLEPLYREAARLGNASAHFVTIGYHPFFLMMGIRTHFNRTSGEPVAVESYIHLFSDHMRAAHRADFVLCEMEERLLDDDWIARKPKHEAYRNRPVSFAMVWRRA